VIRIRSVRISGVLLYPLLLSEFNETWIFWTDFRKILIFHANRFVEWWIFPRWRTEGQIWRRLRLKCDGTSAETRFRLSEKRTSPFKSAGGRQFSRVLAAEVCAWAVVMLDTPCSEVVWRVLATHSIRQFPLYFTFQLDSNSRFLPFFERGREYPTFSAQSVPQSLNQFLIQSKSLKNDAAHPKPATCHPRLQATHSLVLGISRNRSYICDGTSTDLSLFNVAVLTACVIGNNVQCQDGFELETEKMYESCYCLLPTLQPENSRISVEMKTTSRSLETKGTERTKGAEVKK